MRSFSLLIYLAVLWTSAAVAESEGAVVGRLVFFDGNRQLTLREAEGEVGERVTVELRHGARVVEAQVNADGYFAVSGPPGRYRLEYLWIGERAEFVQPLEFEIESDAVTCAGTLGIRTSHIENLGANQDNAMTVTDDCAMLWPRLHELANGGARKRVILARTGPLIENPERKSFIEYAGQVAFELGWSEQTTIVRATFVHPFGSSFVTPALYAGAGVFSKGGQGFDLTVGAGLNLVNIDLLLVGGLRQSSSFEVPGGPVLGAYGRWQIGAFGLGARYDSLPNNLWTFFIDLRPVVFLGMLL
jgi:hypothetical protein